MKKGDRVRLNIGSKFNDGEAENPTDIEGTIIHVISSELGLCVEWDNGEQNYYDEEDLVQSPAFDRTAIATQILSGMMPQRQIAQIQSKKEEIVSTAIELTDELIKQLSE